MKIQVRKSNRLNKMIIKLDSMIRKKMKSKKKLRIKLKKLIQKFQKWKNQIKKLNYKILLYKKMLKLNQI